jgi:hypothetical protein
MVEGWFRSDDKGKQTLERYFNGPDINEVFEAREIINGDKNKVPSWSDGKSIGELVADYHEKFMDALTLAEYPEIIPNDINGPKEPQEQSVVTVSVDAPDDVDVVVILRGEIITK